MSSRVRIAARFCGPPASGNGGYTAGLLAAHLPATGTDGGDAVSVRVTLRKPPPLDTDLAVRADRSGVRLENAQGELIASAEPAPFKADHPPVLVDERSAEQAHAAYVSPAEHPFPSCFVCGPTAVQGLGLQPGQTRPGLTACLWTPDSSLADATDIARVAEEFVWSALDCPGGWASNLQTRPLVLGQITARVSAVALVGRPLVVVGQLVATEGRKTWTASALYDAGVLVARAEHLWIAVDPAAFG